ncbi:MAG: hypothetical protein JWM68_189 [Verrucomicrobiales bacterium]|nr:hypothetical protein [Verrucomicrobiales bacterium]
MSSLALRLFLLLSLFCSSAHADPENILVEGYTFIRPKNWTWDPADKGSALNRFTVPGSSPSRTDVRFYVFPQTEEQIRQRLLGNFEQDAVLHETSAAVNDTKLNYVTVSGKASDQVKKTPGKLKVVGACLRTANEKKKLLVRIYGPPDEVDAATDDFKHMVEKAVEEFGK